MTRRSAILAALVALLPVLGACGQVAPTAASAGDALPAFGVGPPRLREPASTRPAWLSDPPVNPERYRVPDDSFQDHLG
ncbi:MAG: hypothetical protein AAGC69_03215 [Paracraurococcus sp.]|jgi:hypothetical protein